MAEDVVEVKEKNIYQKLKRDESFRGGMPLLLNDDKVVYDQQVVGIYGGDGEEGGKWGRVLFQDAHATKIFHQPDNVLNAFDLEFIREFGGIAGLPEFVGVVPNGYQMKRFRGESLGKLIDQEFDNDYYNKKFTSKQKLQRVISEEQAQELLDRIVEFHKRTMRVHGDLGHMNDVIIDNQGKVRLTDPEWERIGNITPQSEIRGVYQYLTEECGYDDLTLPETISDEEARQGLEEFIKKVAQKVEMDPVVGTKIKKYTDQQVDIKINDGVIEVRQK